MGSAMRGKEEVTAELCNQDQDPHRHNGALRERTKSRDKKELLLQGLFLSRKYGTYVAGSFHLRENVARSEKRK